jgi:hypothetical protein
MVIVMALTSSMVDEMLRIASTAALVADWTPRDS